MKKYRFSVHDLKDIQNAWEQVREMAPLDVEFRPVRCKHCNSNQISRYGRYKDVQLWWCQQCQRKFTGNDASPGMKISSEQIQSALSMYFKGVPVSSIRKQLKEEFDYYPSDSTVYRWVRQSTEKVLEATRDHHPRVGNDWIAYESAILIGLKNYWVSDLIDADSHFLLASRLSANRKVEDARILIESAMQKAHRIPDKIITRNASRYLKAIEQVMGLDFERVKIMRPDKGYEIKFLVYWHNILKGRKRITRNLKSLALVNLTLQGWIIDYNYYSPQRSLSDKSPAGSAGLDTDLSSIVRHL
ncbi:MAG: DDE-type integrase/transposase/recombinase [Dehalococcoidales bacterium]|nr:DDE-type integrase/transposase/recombinase [Dehalococcoidales bacterium]